MTPFDIIIHNRNVLRTNLGSSSYMITFDHVPNAFDSTSGKGSIMRNDVPFLLSKEKTNASIYFTALINAATRVAFLIGKDHENWEEVADKYNEWVIKHKSISGRGCPHKFYYTTYSIYNVNWLRRFAEKIKMIFLYHQFIIYLVRDRTLDQGGGGYFIQIHCYKPMHNKMHCPAQDELAEKFTTLLYDQLCQFSRESKCPCSILTNPSIFSRVEEWAIRNYCRFNSFCYGLIHDIKTALQGKVYRTNTKKQNGN